MEKNTNPLSIKVIYWITNITFWLYLAVTFLAMLLVIAIFATDMNELQLHVGLPILVNINEIGSLDLNMLSHITNVELTQMSGKIHFIDTPPEIARIYGIFLFLTMLLFLYVFVIIRKFVNNVYSGIYFNVKNINLLKRISYAMVIFWLFIVFYGYFQYYFLVINLQFNSLEITGDVQTYPGLLIAALGIWVLSHIFAKGCELQDLNQLTV